MADHLTPADSHDHLPRYLLPDLVRTTAIGLMLIFHTCFDLKNFQVWDLSKASPFWWHYLPNIIVSLFFLAVGLSLVLAHPQTVQWKKFWLRSAKIALGAAAISLVTYCYFPQSWIYFGTLHCIVFIGLVALPLRHYPKLCLGLAVLILGADLGFNVPWPWFSLDHDSLDYIPPLPWISATLLGIWIAQQGWHRWPGSSIPRPLKKIIHATGRHSLLIYLLHQPVIFGICYLLFR